MALFDRGRYNVRLTVAPFYARAAPCRTIRRCLRRRLRHRAQHIERAGLLWLAAEIFADLAPHIRLADLWSLPDHRPAGEMPSLRGFIDDDPGRPLVAAGGGVGFEAVDRVRSGRQGVDVLGRGAALRGVDGHRVAVAQAHRGVLAGLDLSPCDQALGAGIVAHDHALLGQRADFDDLAVVGEDGLAARDTRIMHAIIEAHPVTDRQRQPVGVAVAVGRIQDFDIVAELAGPAPFGPDGGTDLARVGICRRRDRQLEPGIGAVGLQPLAPQPGHALHRRLPAAGDQLGGSVLLLHFQRFGRPAGAEQAGDFALALGLLADRGQDLGNGLFANRLAQQLDDRPGFDRLALLGIADHDDLHAGSFLQPQQIEHLPGAEQPDLVDDHDAVAIEHIPPGLDAFEEGGDRGALGDAGRFEIGRLAPGQGDAEHRRARRLARRPPAGRGRCSCRRRRRRSPPPAGRRWRAASSSPAAPAIALRPDRSPGCARGTHRRHGRSAPPAKPPTNRARRSWPDGSARVPGRYAARS